MEKDKLNLSNDLIFKINGYVNRNECTLYCKNMKPYLISDYGNYCQCCGINKNLTVDHVIPITKGGQNIYINLQLLCLSCNSKKHNKIIDYRKEIKSFY